jgi:hypothetical protein
MKELQITDFDKQLPHVPKNIGETCAILFKLNGCHWCHEMQTEWNKLDKTIGFMSFYTFCVDKSSENTAHWAKIKKSVKNSEQLDGFPVVMLYSTTGRVVMYTGYEEYDNMKAKMIEFMKK